MTILVAGGKGQVGQCFQQLATRYPQWHFVFADLPELDITSRKAVFSFSGFHRGASSDENPNSYYPAVMIGAR